MQETDNKARVGEEKEIDLLELASTLWKQKKKLIKWSLCGALVGLVVAFSIPKEYTTSVKGGKERTKAIMKLMKSIRGLMKKSVLRFAPAPGSCLKACLKRRRRY